ncbi:MAG: GntR family transcriptional regulator [Casimicrobiaceae bacterium]
MNVIGVPVGATGDARRIVRATLPAQVAERLRDMIAANELGADAKLNERELTAQLHISRTPLREAIKVLAAEGLIRLEPNRGAFVANPSPKEVEDLLEAMGALEATCGELACARATDTEIAAVRQTHTRMVKAYERRDRHTYFKLNQEIHRRIAQASRNATLAQLHASLNARLYRIRFMSNKTDRWKSALDEHEAIATALEQRDVRAIRQLLREHLGQTWKKVQAHGY